MLCQGCHDIIQPSGLFSDLHHIAQVFWKNLCLFQGGPKTAGLFYVLQDCSEYLLPFLLGSILQHNGKPLRGGDTGAENECHLAAEG